MKKIMLIMFVILLISVYFSVTNFFKSEGYYVYDEWEENNSSISDFR